MTSKLTEAAKGVYIIAATPFTDDGALDLQSVDTLTDFYIRCGSQGIRDIERSEGTMIPQIAMLCALGINIATDNLAAIVDA